MPLVEAFDLSGCRCWFYSGDHRPAHFHASAPGEWELRVYFLLEPPELEPVFQVKHVPGRVRRELIALAWQHRVRLLQERSEEVNVAEEG